MSFSLSGMMISNCAVPAHATALQGENECLCCTQVVLCLDISCGMLSALGVLLCRICACLIGQWREAIICWIMAERLLLLAFVVGVMRGVHSSLSSLYASWAANINSCQCISECRLGFSLVVCSGFFWGFVRLAFFCYIGCMYFHSDGSQKWSIGLCFAVALVPLIVVPNNGEGRCFVRWCVY